MHVEKKRIFVGNLPPHVNENEIQELFSKYVKVVSIDIKHRKVNSDENISSMFAFVNVETDNRTLQQCFQELSDYSWQGYYINLQLAKESFLERLKREREEAQAKNEQNSSKITPLQNEEHNYKVTPAKTISKKTERSCSSSSNESSSDSDDTDNEKSKPVQNNKMNLNLTKTKEISSSSSSDDSSDSEEEKSNEKPVAEVDDNEFKLIIKNNKYKVKENGGLKIESFNSTPIHIITKNSDKTVKKDQKSLEADEKRKQSLLQMKNTYNQQKNLIKNALSKIDTKQNKIVFNDEEQFNKRKFTNDVPDHSSKKQKVALFDDEGETEDNYNFDVKSQFEGKKGQKLLALQSKFTNDKRFALDERFADDEIEESNEMEIDENEKEKQLDILESVLGHKVRKEKKDDEKRVNNAKGMLRFDPSKPEHAKYEIKRNENEKKTKKKDKKEKVVEKEEDAPVIPEVSKEKFYQVKENLKESLKEKEGFSLLSMFGRAEENVAEENEPKAEEIKKSNYGYNENPFKYDSSDSEDEHKKQKEKPQKKENVVDSRPSFRWAESFFFQTNDSRLKDGEDFLKKIQNSENSETFKMKRYELGRIMHNKTKNVEQDQRRLQRKLRKRIKVKKAKKS